MSSPDYYLQANTVPAFFMAVTCLLYVIISQFIYGCVTSSVDIAILPNPIINYSSVYLEGFTTYNNYWRDSTVNHN
jgi:hypothetical protein